MIDLTNLNRLFGDDPELVLRFLQTIHAQLPEQRELLQAAIHKEDRQEVNLLAHNIKNQLQYLNNDVAAAIAYQIENDSEAGVADWLAIGQAGRQLEIMLEDITKNIGNHLSAG